MTGEFKVRWMADSWSEAGTPARPFNLRMPDGTWQIFGDDPGGHELKIRMPDNTWRKVSRSGWTATPTIYGRVTDLDGMPLRNKGVSLRHITDWGYFPSGFTTTDSNGDYIFTDLPLGYFQVRVDSWRPIHFTDYLNVELTSTKRRARLDITLANQFIDIGWWMPPKILDNGRFAPDTAWLASQIDMLETESRWGEVGLTRHATSSINFQARCVSAMGWTGDEFNSYYRYQEDEAGWFSIPPIPFLRQAAHDTLSAYPQYFTDPELVSIKVNFHLSGFSVIKSQVPWMNSYLLDTTTIGPFSGTGAILYQGDTQAGTFLTGNWVNGRTRENANPVVYPDNPVHYGQFTTPARMAAFAAIRDKIFAREDGSLVWSGSLNDLGATTHGLNRPAIVVSHIIPVDSQATDQQYHMMVSDVPDPRPIDKTVNGHTYENRMSARVSVDFTYRHW